MLASLRCHLWCVVGFIVVWVTPHISLILTFPTSKRPGDESLAGALLTKFPFVLSAGKLCPSFDFWCVWVGVCGWSGCPVVPCSISASADWVLRAVRQVNHGRKRICLSFNLFEDQTTATLRWNSLEGQLQLQGDLSLAYHKNLSVDTLFFVDLHDGLSWSWLLWRHGLKWAAVCLVLGSIL